MIKDKIKQLQYKYQIEQTRKQYESKAKHLDYDDDEESLWARFSQETFSKRYALDVLRVKKLIKKAKSYGIDILPEWRNDAEESFYWDLGDRLTDTGENKLRALVRQKRRESIEFWWTKIIIPSMALLAAIFSVCTAALSVYVAYLALKKK